MDGPKRKYQINLQKRRKTREILSEYMYNHRILNGVLIFLKKNFSWSDRPFMNLMVHIGVFQSVSPLEKTVDYRTFYSKCDLSWLVRFFGVEPFIQIAIILIKLSLLMIITKLSSNRVNFLSLNELPNCDP